MRIYLFLFVLIYCAVVQAKPLIAFERYGFIWTANIDGTNAKKITQGYIPEISPDGKYIAFNLVEKAHQETVTWLLLSLNQVKSPN